MPVTKGAIRKQRADRQKTVINDRVRNLYRAAVKKMRREPSAKNLVEAYRRLDRAAKSHVIHKNKAARLKSRLTKLLPKPKAAPKLTPKIAKTKKLKS